MHGALLVRALRARAAAVGLRLTVIGLGGSRMRAAGVQLISDTEGVGGFGLAEALPYVVPVLRMWRRIRRCLGAEPTDLAVLIDYPGVNIPLGSILHRRYNIPVVYYVPSEEWGWSTKGSGRFDRTRTIVEAVDLVLATHPREAEFYSRSGCRVALVGHPLQDSVAARRIGRREARSALGVEHEETVVALFPASRPQELKLVWPLIAAAAARMAQARSGLTFLVPAAAARVKAGLEKAVAKSCRACPDLNGSVRVVDAGAGFQRATALVSAAADVAIAKAGTVNLELALQNVPQVAVYRVGRVSQWLAHHVIGISLRDFPHVAPPNFISASAIVPEFLQHAARPEAISATALALLDPSAPARAEQLAGYARLRELLGGEGAADRAAEAILAMLIAGKSAAYSFSDK